MFFRNLILIPRYTRKYLQILFTKQTNQVNTYFLVKRKILICLKISSPLNFNRKTRFRKKYKLVTSEWASKNSLYLKILSSLNFTHKITYPKKFQLVNSEWNTNASIYLKILVSLNFTHKTSHSKKYQLVTSECDSYFNMLVAWVSKLPNVPSLCG